MSGNCSSQLGFQSNVTSMSPQPILRLRPSSSICFLCRSTVILLLSATIISLRPLIRQLLSVSLLFFPGQEQLVAGLAQCPRSLPANCRLLHIISPRWPCHLVTPDPPSLAEKPAPIDLARPWSPCNRSIDATYVVTSSGTCRQSSHVSTSQCHMLSQISIS